MPGDLCTAPRIISLHLSLGTDVTDATLGTSGIFLGTRTGADGTATLTKGFFLAAAHGSMDNSIKNRPTDHQCIETWETEEKLGRVTVNTEEMFRLNQEVNMITYELYILVCTEVCCVHFSLTSLL